MKKLFTLLACSLLLCSACNRNKRFNKILNGGTWICTSINGKDVSADNAIRMTFTKGARDGGNVNIISYTNGVKDEATVSGTYKITNHGITLTIDGTGNVPALGSSAAYTYTYKNVGTISESSGSSFKSHEVLSSTVKSGGVTAPLSKTQDAVYTKQ